LPRQVRERQILDAAISVFSRRGFHLASMDEIAEVSKPMIYAYLGSKDDLFTACIRREALRLRGDTGSPGNVAMGVLWTGLKANRSPS
jgi:AcrR family transcriptional regulator